ncbi:MAG TPA: M48 family metallopeptidase [Chthonomonadales bacterium]|nr:M48 family metallopeptidase [Chthonomonadales bacterium]
MHSGLRRLGHLATVGLVLLGCSLLPMARAYATPQQGEECEDVRLGRESAAEFEKSARLVTDPAIVERVNRIGQEIAAVANTEQVPMLYGLTERRRFTYVFRVVDDKDVNAFSLPGGFIYVNRGLLDFAQSDDELAGVIAHEVAHAAHRHMMKLIAEQSRLQQQVLLPILAYVLLGRPSGDDAGNVMLAGQLYIQARRNTWSIEAERDADQAAVRYLVKTRFNPVGLLTFMERLARKEMLGPQRELGIFRTHPLSAERTRSLIAVLEELRVPLNRRDVDPSLRVTGTQSATVTGLAEVRMGDTVLARLVGVNGMTADERAARAAAAINRMMDQGLLTFELRLSTDRTRVLARRQVLVEYTAADAAAAGGTPSELAEQTRKALQTLLWQDQFNRVPASAGPAR